MKKEFPYRKLILYLSIGTGLSALFFLSASFASQLFDIDTFNPSADYDDYRFNIGVPLVYYSEYFYSGNRNPSTSFNPLYLLLDCFAFWGLIALPYTYFKLRKHLPKKQKEENLIDQIKN